MYHTLCGTCSNQSSTVIMWLGFLEQENQIFLEGAHENLIYVSSSSSVAKVDGQFYQKMHLVQKGANQLDRVKDKQRKPTPKHLRPRF